MSVASVLIRIVGENRSALAAIRQTDAEMAKSRRSIGVSAAGMATAATTAFTFIAAAAIPATLALRAANKEYDATVRLQRDLSATARIAGADLNALRASAAGIGHQFKLSTGLATQLTTEVTRLADRLGDMSRVRPLSAAFLQLGAARGFNPNETAGLLGQGNHGAAQLIGESTTQIYDEFARSVGRTRSELTEQEKVLAIATRAMEAASRVGGEYLRFLDEADGKQFQINEELRDAKLAFAEAIQPARIALLQDMADAFGEMAGYVRDNQDEIERWADNFERVASALVKIAGFGAAVLNRPVDWARSGDASTAGLGVGEAQRLAREAHAARQAAEDERLRSSTIDVDRAQVDPARLNQSAAAAAAQRTEQDAARSRALAEARLAAARARLEPGSSRIDVRDPIDRLEQAASLVEKIANDLGMDADLRRVRSLDDVVGDRLRERTKGAAADKARILGLDDAAAKQMRAEIDRMESRVQRFADTFTSAVMHMVQGSETLADSLRNVAAATTLAFANDFVSQGVGRVTASLMSGKIGDAARDAANADEKPNAVQIGENAADAASAGGPAGWGMLAAGVGLSMLTGLLGNSRDREEEQYRAHMRALKDSREQRMNVINISLPDGPVDFSHPVMKEALSEGIESLGGTRSNTRINYGTRRTR